MRTPDGQRRPIFWLPTAVILLSVIAGCGHGEDKTPGARLYDRLCASCHQRDGAGAKGLYPPLAGTPVPTGDGSVMAAWVLLGVRPPSLPRGAYAGVMPQFNYLSDVDAAAVINYVRSSFSNAATPVTAEQIAAVRARYATP